MATSNPSTLGEFMDSNGAQKIQETVELLNSQIASAQRAGIRVEVTVPPPPLPRVRVKLWREITSRAEK